MNKTNTLAAILIMVCSGLPAQIPDKAVDITPLLIGEKIPESELSNASGEKLNLTQLFSTKPSVVIFYRGSWCPYCNVHLAELQSIESDILGMGYQIIAISPDSPENLNGTMDKHALNYTLLSDASMSVARAFGIAFSVQESSKERLAKSSGGLNPGQLPVPSVFVVNQEGEILFEYINPDYKKRIKGKLLLAVLKELSKS